MDRLKFEEQTATSAAAVTTGIQQIDIAVETDSAELLQNLLLDAMTAAVTGSTDPVDKLQQTLTGAFSHFKNMIAAREEDRYNEWQTERELLEAEIQTLRELMQAKDQRLKFYVSRALFQ
jgi:hypothetical protein